MVYDLWWGATGITLTTDLGGVLNDLWAVSPGDPTHGHKLTSGQAEEDSPSVSADGRWLVYTDNRESATALMVRDLATGDEGAVIPTRIDFGAVTGTLRLKVMDRATGKPVVGRLSVEEVGGKCHAPMGALYYLTNDLIDFYGGDVSLTLPAGRYVVRARRGIEYRELERTIDVAPRSEKLEEVRLERWTDPAARGLWSGDNHIHANYGGQAAWYDTPEVMRTIAEGEGLNFANMMVANSENDTLYDRLFFRGEPDPVSGATTIVQWNEEFRAVLWGHISIFNLKRLVEPVFTGFAGTTNPWDVPTNADIADHVHLQGGVVNYVHPAWTPEDPYADSVSAKGLPMDAAIGKVDSMDINATWDAAVAMWYRLLNCGLRIGASAGTDAFVNRLFRGARPGSSRVYVRLGGPFVIGAWVDGLRAGRTFVTNGPMVDLKVAEQGPGDTVKLAAPGDVAVRARADAATALERVELVFRGAVVATGVLAPDRLSGIIEQKVRVPHSGWFSLRAHGPGKTQAHSGAVYVTVAEKPASAREEANYFLRWLDRLEADVRARDRIPTVAAKAHVAGQFAAARAFYRRLVDPPPRSRPSAPTP
jgi:hypothetical protein